MMLQAAGAPVVSMPSNEIYAGDADRRDAMSP